MEYAVASEVMISSETKTAEEPEGELMVVYEGVEVPLTLGERNGNTTGAAITTVSPSPGGTTNTSSSGNQAST